MDSTQSAAFKSKIEEIKKSRGETVSISEIGDVVGSLLGTLHGDFSTTDIRLYRELDELAKYIRSAKSEIAEIQPDQIRSNLIDRATDELDAIVKATETATSAILDCAETLGNIAGNVAPEHGQTINDVVTKIFEASTFQDITGQRVTKVVNALKHIEIELDKIVKVFGAELRKSTAPGSTAKSSNPDGGRLGKPGDTRPDATLLHGPQLAGKGASQDEIDSLLAGT